MEMGAILKKNTCFEVITERVAKITNDMWNEIESNAIVDLYLAIVDRVLSSMTETKRAKVI